MIRATYAAEPRFPATDQHPDAKRFQFDGMWIDATHDLTEAEWTAFRLDQAKTAATVEISAAAEARRSAITAAAAGQQLEYLLLYELVLKAKNGDENAAAKLLTNAQARGVSYDQHILDISGKRFAQEDAWMAISDIRHAAKAAVASASDRAAVDAAVADARQQLAGIGG